MGLSTFMVMSQCVANSKRFCMEMATDLILNTYLADGASSGELCPIKRHECERVIEEEIMLHTRSLKHTRSWSSILRRYDLKEYLRGVDFMNHK